MQSCSLKIHIITDLGRLQLQELKPLHKRRFSTDEVASVLGLLIQQQSIAENRDIVAVAIDEATLKRFVRMGDSVLLMPESQSMSQSSCQIIRRGLWG